MVARTIFCLRLARSELTENNRDLRVLVDESPRCPDAQLQRSERIIQSIPSMGHVHNQTKRASALHCRNANQKMPTRKAMSSQVIRFTIRHRFCASKRPSSPVPLARVLIPSLWSSTQFPKPCKAIPSQRKLCLHFPRCASQELATTRRVRTGRYCQLVGSWSCPRAACCHRNFTSLCPAVRDTQFDPQFFCFLLFERLHLPVCARGWWCGRPRHVVGHRGTSCARWSPGWKRFRSLWWRALLMVRTESSNELASDRTSCQRQVVIHTTQMVQQEEVQSGWRGAGAYARVKRATWHSPPRWEFRSLQHRRGRTTTARAGGGH